MRACPGSARTATRARAKWTHARATPRRRCRRGRRPPPSWRSRRNLLPPGPGNQRQFDGMEEKVRRPGGHAGQPARPERRSHLLAAPVRFGHAGLLARARLSDACHTRVRSLRGGPCHPAACDLDGERERSGRQRAMGPPGDGFAGPPSPVETGPHDAHGGKPDTRPWGRTGDGRSRPSFVPQTTPPPARAGGGGSRPSSGTMSHGRPATRRQVVQFHPRNLAVAATVGLRLVVATPT